MTVKQLKTKRAKLVKEAEALRGEGGTFATDDVRAAFDAKMTDVEGIDEKIRKAESGDEDSEFLREEQVEARRRPAADADADDDESHEPNDRDRGADAERTRMTGILDACKAARLPQSFARKLIDEKVPLLDAQTRIFKELSVREDPRPNEGPNAGARASVEGDGPMIHSRDGITEALLHRCNPEHFKLTDKGREYRGMSMLDIARTYLNHLGVRTTSMSRMDIAGAALGLTNVRGMHTTSDFPYLLADVANKSLRADYEAAPQTFMPFVQIGSVPDFKTANRVQVGDAPALHPVGEHGEFTRGTIAEGREQVQAASYGRVFAITRTALVNDDLDAFSKVPQKFARMARNLESDLVYYQLLKNAAMNDGTALFAAGHANYAAAGDISVTNVSAGDRAMMLQTGLDAVTLLNLSPKYLLVGPTKKTKALQFVSQTLQAATQANVNPYAGQLVVITEARLENGVTIGPSGGGSTLTASGSAYAWYLAADKAQIDIIELVFLEGQNGPVIESRVGFDVDGLEIKCREDVGAKVLDHRGLYKSDGSDAS